MSSPRPPPMLSVAELFARHVADRPHAPCVLARGKWWSYGRVAQQARALAVTLRRLGVEPGDRVAVVLPNWHEFVVSALAAAEAGAVLVPLPIGGSAREMRYALRNSEAAVVIAAESWDGVDYLQRVEALLDRLPDLRHAITVGEEDTWYDDRVCRLDDALARGRGRDLPPTAIDPPSHPFAICYAPSASGGLKGVVLTHDNALRTALETVSAAGIGPGDRTLCTAPFSNVFGLAALLGALGTGGSLLTQQIFDAAGALALAEEHDATVLHGVPTTFVMCLRELSRGAPRPGSLRTGIICGAPVAGTLARDVRRRLAAGAEVAYGLTETSPIVSITTPSDSESKRAHTVGRPLRGVEVRVLDDSGTELPTESVGELAVRGYNVMRGYFRQPGRTRSVMTADGFLRTGDLAMLDPEGYLHIVGRLSDVIIRGGTHVHPAEIEAHLRSHPAVDDAVVLGVPDDVLGELVCACLAMAEGALLTVDEVRDFCREALAEERVPDAVHFLDELPAASSDRARRVTLARALRATVG